MGGKGSGRKATIEATLSPRVDPWDRQPREGDQAFRAFIAYRDLGFDRTMAKAVVELGKKPNYRSTCEAWSIRWGWRLRVSAWDGYQDRREREAAMKVAEKKATQRASFADAMWMTAMRGLSLWNEYLQDFTAQQSRRKDEGRDLSPPPISPGDVQRLADIGIKLALLLEGKPTEIGEQRHEYTVDDRRREVQRLIGDTRVRKAMKVVAEAAGDNDGRVIQ